MRNIIRVGLFGERSRGNGLGRFAVEIKQALDLDLDFEAVLPNNSSEVFDVDVVVYVSQVSKQLQHAIKVCEVNDVPLLVLSTDVTEDLNKITKSCEVHLIPNSSLEVMDYIAEVKDFWSKNSDWPVTITEYHQSSKANISGTAIEIAKQIHFPEHKIVSLRDDDLAKQKFNIPNQYLNGYAVHQVEFTNPKTHEPTMFEIKILGRTTYVQGLLKIIANILQKKTANRK
jgi:dihydrodipicolinate reductase